MLNLTFIITLISLAFIFFIFSCMASMVYEYIAKLLKIRSTFLAQSLSKILKDEFINGVDFSLLMYDHPLVTSLKQNQDTYPSYLPARTFALALIEVVIHHSTGYTFTNQEKGDSVSVSESMPGDGSSVFHDTFDNYKKAVEALANSNLRTLLASFLINAKNHSDLQKNIELWYDEYMERASGWFKKQTAKKMFVIAAAITLFFNVDTIHIIKTLETSKQLNTGIADAAQLYVNSNKDAKFDSVSTKEAKQLLELSDSLGVPVGYDFKNEKLDNQHQNRLANFWDSLRNQAEDDGGWVLLLFGWIVSATAIARGAPFWFDILSRLVNIRSSGDKPKKSKDNAN